MKLLIDEELRAAGVLAAFTTRAGGVSRPPYDSLNLAGHTGDLEVDVTQNRRRLARELGTQIGSLTFAEQVHGADVAMIEERLAGAGAVASSPRPPRADAMVTAAAGIYLVVLTADCLPIILADAKNRVVAVVHAGWRGTLEKIAARTLEVMVEAGARRPQIKARLGPAIGECCFEVSADLWAGFSEEFKLKPAPTAGRPHLSLARLNTQVLVEAGLAPENISSLDLCTRDNPDRFFSWRRDKETGRQAAVVALEARPKTPFAALSSASPRSRT